MDPKALLLLPGLVAPQRHDAKTPTMLSLTAPVTHVYEWPEREREPLEGDHPGHGDGSDESWMFVGINSNVSNTASVTVDSGASGIGPYTSFGWLPKGLNLVASFDELEVVERVPAALPYATDLNVSPNASKHLTNPSTIQTRRSFTRRG